MYRQLRVVFSLGAVCLNTLIEDLRDSLREISFSCTFLSGVKWILDRLLRPLELKTVFRSLFKCILLGGTGLFILILLLGLICIFLRGISLTVAKFILLQLLGFHSLFLKDSSQFSVFMYPLNLATVVLKGNKWLAFLEDSPYCSSLGNCTLTFVTCCNLFALIIKSKTLSSSVYFQSPHSINFRQFWFLWVGLNFQTITSRVFVDFHITNLWTIFLNTSKTTSVINAVNLLLFTLTQLLP